MLPLGATWQLMGQVREAALAAGRDPSTLELVIYASGTILERSPGANRPDFVGTLDEIARDVATARDLGATEIIFEPGYASGDLCLDEYMHGLEHLRPLVREMTSSAR